MEFQDPFAEYSDHLFSFLSVYGLNAVQQQHCTSVSITAKQNHVGQTRLQPFSLFFFKLGFISQKRK